MSRSRITQADVARAIRAARQAGAGTVRILPDGTICIDLQPKNGGESTETIVATEKDIVL
jgi:acid phosphatase class B